MLSGLRKSISKAVRRPAIARIAVALALMPGAPRAGQAQTPLGTAFTYQGRLTDAGVPATGSYDMQFTLFGASTGGSVVGSPVTVSPVAVASGLFTASLDFGASAFTGSKRWLEIGVRPAGSVNAYTLSHLDRS